MDNKEEAMHAVLNEAVDLVLQRKENHFFVFQFSCF